VEADAAIAQQHHEAGDRGVGGAEREGQGDRAFDIDAAQCGHGDVIGAGTDGAAEARSGHHQPQRRIQSDRQRDDNDLGGVDGEREPGCGAQLMRAREHWLDPPVIGALQQAQRLLEEDGEAEGRDQRRLGRHFAERPEHQPLGRKPVHRSDASDQRQHREQGERQRPEPKERQCGHRDERGVRTNDRDLAEGEIDPPDDAVNQGVADREQAVETAEREAVHDELHEVQKIT
jgi:hypothetical protein